MAKARTFHFAQPETVPAEVAELILDNNSIAQISEAPIEQGTGFLIRVWPPNGTHEHGGSNMPTLSLSIIYNETGKPELKHLDYYNRD